MEALLEAAEVAADWLCDAHTGSDQWERGQKLHKEIRKVKLASRS